MALTKEQRDALPDSDFAVPGKRDLPIHDAVHVRMAWNMLDRTKGLTDAERTEARKRILRRAKELDIDTAKWNLQAMRFEAMAIDIPDVDGHPNRIPFSGVMTRVDSASDNPVGGAKGKRVLIPKAVAEAALSSLLGMGVDYEPGMAGHDSQRKIGVITAAVIDGDAINIEGFFYGADFPAVVADIQSRKSLMGFSYEAQAAVADWNSDPVEVTSCVFTGAAILLKDKAAYTSTSLAAKAAPELSDMDIKELLDQMAEIKQQNEKLAADFSEMKAHADKLEAASVLPKVKPHSDRLREAADAMEKDGMGGHEKRGHVAHLRHMADRMDADAVMGKLPHIYTDDSWMEAAANPAVDELRKEVGALKEQLFAQAQSPGRKTEAGTADKTLAAGGEKDYRQMDADLKAKGASPQKRLSAITAARMGLN